MINQRIFIIYIAGWVTLTEYYPKIIIKIEMCKTKN